MSYADKHHPKPTCHEPGCEQDADRLVIKSGRPDWYCPTHEESDVQTPSQSA